MAETSNEKNQYEVDDATRELFTKKVKEIINLAKENKNVSFLNFNRLFGGEYAYGFCGKSGQ